MLQKPRGTNDLYGDELLKTQEICRIIRQVFSSYGYSEMRTPIFEHLEVFSENDSSLLGANKEFFHLKSRNSDQTEYVLRPENTASIARAIVENKLINHQVNYPLRYFYEGYYFRYERPQSGRFRQFTQLGIEKINSCDPEDDIENLLLVQDIQARLKLNLILKINYLGDGEAKAKWNETLKKYFENYRDQLTPLSQNRIQTNPLRILDDKVDSEKEFVKNAPKIDKYLLEKDLIQLGKIKNLIASLGIISRWDPGLVRGIDYYTGLVYEWVDPKENITVVAGGRYDQLFERFNYSPTPSLGLAMGVERIKMIMERDGLYEWGLKSKYLYLHPKEEPNDIYHKWVNNIRQFLINNHHDILCIASYKCMSHDKHRKLAQKYSKNNPLLIREGGNKKLTDEEQKSELETIINTMYAL